MRPILLLSRLCRHPRGDPTPTIRLACVYISEPPTGFLVFAQLSEARKAGLQGVLRGSGVLLLPLAFLLEPDSVLRINTFPTDVHRGSEPIQDLCKYPGL